jgi:hypothetical protein
VQKSFTLKVSFAMITACASPEPTCEQPRHARAVQALGGLAAIDDDVD